MQVSAGYGQDYVVVTVEEGRIDALVALEFKDKTHALVRSGPHRVILDLSRVQFIDSSGLGAVVSLRRMLAPEQRLELAALGPDVARVFRLTRIDRVIQIHDQPPPSEIGMAVA
jgi:anti-sigma B factor antagonist